MPHILVGYVHSALNEPLTCSQTTRPSIFLNISRCLLDYFQSSISPLLMARQPSRKRPLEHGPQDHPQVKKTKTGHQQHHKVQTYPPSPPCLSQDFDLLSASQKGHADEISPYPPTLPTPPPQHNRPVKDTRIPLTRQALKKLDKMSSRRSRNSRRSKTSTDSSSQVSRRTKATSVSQESGKSIKSDKVTPYSSSFPQLLADEGIYPDDSRSKLANLEELQQDRGIRPSLEPPECSDSEINDVLKASSKAVTELDVERDVVPAIVGRRHLLPHGSDVSWTNMESMTKNQTVPPKPDLYYGTDLDDIDRSLRDSIGHLIVPSTVPNAPGAPYLLLETKGPSGSLAVLKRQLTHAGAAAARAQFVLDNFGKPEPEYDNKALVHAWGFYQPTGDLIHHVVHVSEAGPSQQGYHVTQVMRYSITNSPLDFRKGASAFRHSRDESKAESQARLDKAHEHLRRIKQQSSHGDTSSGPAHNEILIAAPLPQPLQEDLNDEYLAPVYPGSTPPPHISEANGDADDLSGSEDQALVDQQLWDEYGGSFPQEIYFPSTVVTTSTTSGSISVAAPHVGTTTYSSVSRTKGVRWSAAKYAPTGSRPNTRSRVTRVVEQ